MVDGSTCGLAGLLLRRMIFVFFADGSREFSSEVFIRACVAGAVESGGKGVSSASTGIMGCCVSISAIIKGRAHAVADTLRCEQSWRGRL